MCADADLFTIATIACITVLEERDAVNKINFNRSNGKCLLEFPICIPAAILFCNFDA